jgi:oligopeptide transport system ATP-binding protein
MNNLMLDVRNLKKYFTPRKRGIGEKTLLVKAVDDVSFSVERGQTLGVVGESGSGKTTAVRSMLRLIEPDSGEIFVQGTAVHSLDREELRNFRRNMQIVFQDPFSSLNPRMKIGKIISEPLRVHGNGFSKEKIRESMESLLDMVGLQPEHEDRFPHEFSGGQRQRIGIARALALNPSLLVLDEPVSALDVSIQGQILNLLEELQEKLNLTYIFVAHDLAVVKHISDRIVVMYLGRIVEDNTTDGLFNQPLHPYTRSLLNSVPDAKPVKHGFSVIRGEIPSPENPPAGCHFHPRCPHRMDICAREYPRLRIHGDNRVACHLY